MSTPTPWPEPEYHNDVGPDDEGFWEWYDAGGFIEIAAFFSRVSKNRDLTEEEMGLLERATKLSE